MEQRRHIPHSQELVFWWSKTIIKQRTKRDMMSGSDRCHGERKSTVTFCYFIRHPGACFATCL